MECRAEDRRTFGKQISDFAERLKKLYAEIAANSAEEKKAKKDAAFAEFRKAMAGYIWKSESYKSGFLASSKMILTTIVLLAHLTYEDHQEVFDRVLKCEGSLVGPLTC